MRKESEELREVKEKMRKEREERRRVEKELREERKRWEEWLREEKRREGIEKIVERLEVWEGRMEERVESWEKEGEGRCGKSQTERVEEDCSRRMRKLELRQDIKEREETRDNVMIRGLEVEGKVVREEVNKL